MLQSTARGTGTATRSRTRTPTLYLLQSITRGTGTAARRRTRTPILYLLQSTARGTGKATRRRRSTPTLQTIDQVALCWDFLCLLWLQFSPSEKIPAKIIQNLPIMTTTQRTGDTRPATESPCHHVRNNVNSVTNNLSIRRQADQCFDWSDWWSNYDTSISGFVFMMFDKQVINDNN